VIHNFLDKKGNLYFSLHICFRVGKRRNIIDFSYFEEATGACEHFFLPQSLEIVAKPSEIDLVVFVFLLL